MAGGSELLSRASRETRQWAARLCLADTDEEAAGILAEALLDLGFESVDSLQRGGPGGVTLRWSRLGAIGVPANDPFVAARRHTLAQLDPTVHRWIARQPRVITQDEFLALHKSVYTQFMHLPCDFGHSRWRTKISIPYAGDDRGLSMGVASMAPFDVLSDRLGDLRFLVHVYYGLTAPGGADEVQEEAETTPLTHKQTECLRWAAAGKSYADIADIVGISQRTVRYHLECARRQYGFATIMQTIVQAAKQHDFDPLDPR